MNMVIKCLLAALWLLAVPWAAGGVVLCKSKKSSMGMNLLAGYLMMFSFAEILALAAIWAKLPLHVLKYSLAAVMASAAVLGIVLALVKRNGFTGNGEKTGKMSFYFVVAAILILLQLVAASFLAHMDADDAFYVATATTSVHTDTVFSINPYTGYSYTRLPSRYVLSPFPIFLAVISSLVGLHPAIVAHVIFPVVFIFMAYLVLYQYAKRWFPEDEHARGIFMIFCAVLIWFSAYSVYNSENFQMIRIWQGKACLASGKRTGIFMAAAFTGRYFLLPPFFHGNYSGLYDAGDTSDHGTGTVSQSAESSMYGFVLSAVAASWTCVYYDPIGENNERNNCMDS